jgi:predicted  nucleic acid-binding Zn-ribbon protein
MAMPATKFELEAPLEDRVTRLEVTVEHIRKDVSERKTDIRRLNDKIETVDNKLTAKIDAVDQKLTAKIDDVEEKLTAKIDGVEEKLTAKIDGVDQRLTGKIDSLKDVVTALAINMEKQFGTLRVARALDRVWYLLMTGGILGIMARAFKWV